MSTRFVSLAFLGFPTYCVGNNGSVWSWKSFKRTWKQLKPISLKPQANRLGYLRVKLCHEGDSGTFLVHRLVLFAFEGSCPTGMEARHLDGDTRNNRISNLVWGTQSENQLDRIVHGTTNHGKSGPVGEDRYNTILTPNKVLKIRRIYRKDRLGYKALGKRFGVEWSTIRSIIKRRSWKHI